MPCDRQRSATFRPASPSLTIARICSSVYVLRFIGPPLNGGPHSMRRIGLKGAGQSHFAVQGFTRTYWDFFLGTGFIVGVFYLFAAVVAWQLGGLPKVTLASMRVTAWSFALCFAAVTVISWQFVFWIAIVFSAAVTVCLTAAAWCSGADAA